MSADGIWHALEGALDRWRAVARAPAFWLRDDDAIEPTPALKRLTALTHGVNVPLMLAVIPAHATPALAHELADRPIVTAVVHGWSHENHADADRKKQELGPDRPAKVVLAELARGLETIAELFGEKMAPVLVPPWNRIDPALLPHLKATGFQALSTFGQPKPETPIRIINPTVDIIDWHGTRSCREHAVLVDEVVGELDAALLDRSRPPIGILTHHLVHDEAAWTFLEKLFEITAAKTDRCWRSTRELLAA